MWNKILKWWWFTVKNPVIRKGESGGFKWKFRRFWLEISTVSGNFKCRFMASDHPYAVLVGCEKDETIHGFCSLVYQVSSMLTTDAGFVGDIQNAIKKYDKRLQKQAASEVKEDEIEEKVALETEKAIQEVVEMPKKERKKVEKKIDKRFKNTVAQSLKEKEA